LKYAVKTATYTIEADSHGAALKEFLDLPHVTVIVDHESGFGHAPRTFRVTSMPRKVRDEVLRVLSQWQNDKMTAREAVQKCLDILEGV
jgi:hypothetical protein